MDGRGRKEGRKEGRERGRGRRRGRGEGGIKSTGSEDWMDSQTCSLDDLSIVPGAGVEAIGCHISPEVREHTERSDQ